MAPVCTVNPSAPRTTRRNSRHLLYTSLSTGITGAVTTVLVGRPSFWLICFLRKPNFIQRGIISFISLIVFLCSLWNLLFRRDFILTFVSLCGSSIQTTKNISPALTDIATCAECIINTQSWKNPFCFHLGEKKQINSITYCSLVGRLFQKDFFLSNESVSASQPHKYCYYCQDLKACGKHGRKMHLFRQNTQI